MWAVSHFVYSVLVFSFSGSFLRARVTCFLLEAEILFVVLQSWGLSSTRGCLAGSFSPFSGFPCSLKKLSRPLLENNFSMLKRHSCAFMLVSFMVTPSEQGQETHLCGGVRRVPSPPELSLDCVVIARGRSWCFTDAFRNGSFFGRLFCLNLGENGSRLK